MFTSIPRPSFSPQGERDKCTIKLFFFKALWFEFVFYGWRFFSFELIKKRVETPRTTTTKSIIGCGKTNRLSFPSRPRSVNRNKSRAKSAFEWATTFYRQRGVINEQQRSSRKDWFGGWMDRKKSGWTKSKIVRITKFCDWWSYCFCLRWPPPTTLRVWLS